MPFVEVSVSCELTEEKEKKLVSSFGKIIEEIPGKNESNLMMKVNDNCSLWFKGDNSKPIAFVNVAIYGKAEAEKYSAFSSKVLDFLEAELSIDKKDVYIKIEENYNWYKG